MYALLLTQVQDKNYIAHTSDSLIRIAVNYYDFIGNEVLAARAHYYLGRAFQDMGDSPTTVYEFMTSLHLLEESKDDDLCYLLYSNLGRIFYNQKLYDRADSLYAIAVQLAEQRGDSTRLASMYIMQGYINLEKGEVSYSTAEGKLEKAYNIAERIDVKAIKLSVYSALTTLYNRTRKPERAIGFAKRSLSMQNDSLSLYNEYAKLGDAYYLANYYDSAMVCLNKALAFGDYYAKAGACMRLSDIAQAQNRMDKALLYQEFYTAYLDSAKQTEHTTEIVAAVKDAQIHHVTNTYKSFLSKYKYYMYLLGSFLLIMAGYFIYSCFASSTDQF